MEISRYYIFQSKMMEFLQSGMKCTIGNKSVTFKRVNERKREASRVCLQ